MRHTSKQVPFAPWNLSQQGQLGWERFHGGKGRECHVTFKTMETCPSVNAYTPVWMRPYQVFIYHSNTYMHHVEIAYVSYFNNEFLAGNSLELVYRYKKKAPTVYRISGNRPAKPAPRCPSLLMNCFMSVVKFLAQTFGLPWNFFLASGVLVYGSHYLTATRMPHPYKAWKSILLDLCIN